MNNISSFVLPIFFTLWFFILLLLSFKKDEVDEKVKDE